MAVAPYDLEPDNDSQWQELADEKEASQDRIVDISRLMEHVDLAIDSLEHLRRILDVQHPLEQLEELSIQLVDEREYMEHVVYDLDEKMRNL